jgi:hypothetical protein
VPRQCLRIRCRFGHAESHMRPRIGGGIADHGHPAEHDRWRVAIRFRTSMPSRSVPAPLACKASNISGWPVMPAPRPTSSTFERS